MTPVTLFRQRSELLDFLLEVAAVSTGSLELEKLLPALAGLVKKVIPYEIFAILLTGDKGDSLRIHYAIGHREEVIKKLSIKVGEGITGAAAASRQPVLVNDVRRDPRYLNAIDAVRSELAVPMIARDRVVGVIDIQATQVDAFTAEDQAIVELIASRTAMAIDNARLYRRVVRQNRTLRTLASIAQEFSSILDLDPLLRSISEQVRKLINYDAFSILLLEPSKAILKHYISVRYDQRIELDNIPLGRGIVGACAESGQAVLVPDTSNDPRYLAMEEGIRSEVAVPLQAKGQVIGVLDLESEQVHYFTEEHVRTLSLLAPQIATAVENARLYERVAEKELRLESDLTAARTLQRHLLPSCCPPVEGLDLAAHFEPAREIGGDLYDFFQLSRNRLAIAIGDVSGKGAAAALYAALVSGVLRTVVQTHRSPAELLSAVNVTLVERKIDANFVALLAAEWRPDSRTLRMANAGLPLPIICRRGKATEKRVEGIPVGLLPDISYEEVTVNLAAGDVVVLCSDGIVDNRDEFGQEYGRERLVQVVEQHWQLPIQELIQKIFMDVQNHAAGTPSFDDQTMVLLKVR
jgi:sigma-B regulation protein RsbU (phosphoserine phosphatase)